jgi:hypothetical protein
MYVYMYVVYIYIFVGVCKRSIARAPQTMDIEVLLPNKRFCSEVCISPRSSRPSHQIIQEQYTLKIKGIRSDLKFQCETALGLCALYFLIFS